MEPIRILLLTANPRLPGYDPLQLGAEVRQVEEALRRSQHRDRYELKTQMATRPKDLSRALLDYRPHIVHFSGHGSGEEGLLLENDAGKFQLLSTEALVQLFQVSEYCDVQCVLLNACYSEVQAIAIHQVVDCVIGMNQPIGDKSAIQFAERFYDALGAGYTYEEAYRAGRTAILVEGGVDHEVPVLKLRKRREPPVAASQPEPQTPAPPPPTPAPPSQSQSFGNVTIGGSGNQTNFSQAGGDINITRSISQSGGDNKELQAALDALATLRQEVQASQELSAYTKRRTGEDIQMIEEELQKPQPDKGMIDEVVEALGKGLDGALKLATPVSQVAALIAKAYVGLL
ncbi:MAG: CHAT domain-containing protein [Cyanobacteria bacterium P01_A01_bin.135]